MTIILDSCIIYNDPFLKSARIENLCASAIAHGITIALPCVVFDERINQYRENIEESIGQLKKKAKEYNRLTDDLCNGLHNLQIPNVKDLVDKYKLALKNRLDNLNISILNYPDTNHRDIVRKDLLGIKPFKKKGEGYRDALIWETILKYLKPATTLLDDPQIIFVTENTDDFFNKEKSGLHQQLIDELKKKGFSENAVVAYKSIGEVLKNVISPMQETLDKVREELKEVPYIGTTNLNQFFASEAEEKLKDTLNDDENWNIIRLLNHSILENPDVVDFNLNKFMIEDVRKIDEKKILITMKGEAEVQIEGFMDKSDYWINDGFPEDNISASDWNDYYMSVSLGRVFSIRGSIIVNPFLTEIESSDIEIENL